MQVQDKIVEEFVRRFGTQPAVVVRAPGRVNLIGEHTDYNDGFVLPMAIDRAIWLALRPRVDRLVSVYSLEFDQSAAFSLDTLRHESAGWPEYIKGTAWSLQEAGCALRGWDGVVGGDVPIGAGLSSSAALEMATARAFAVVSDLPWDPPAMARLGQRAENKWVGMNCGIMDQMISAAGRAGHALLIDCRSLDTRSAPLPSGTVVVVLDTATRRGLVGSAYNDRRAQCEAAARWFGVPALRDVSVERFLAEGAGLDELPRRRARHIVTENARVLQAAEAMERGDAVEVGRLMDESHVSMRDDFEISTSELDVIVQCAGDEQSCYGARMTGAGFGGCAVALVNSKAAQAFATHVAGAYTNRTGLVPAVYICNATAGAEVWLGGTAPV